MRADYATSDLISKVNSDWINEVLATNPEFNRAGQLDEIPGDRIPGDAHAGESVPGDDVPADHDVGDLRLRREFARRALLLQGASARIDHSGQSITAGPMARLARRRSVARRVKERLALAAGVLAVIWTAVWMAPESQDAANSKSTGASTASLEPPAPINSYEPRPGWLLPEILYGPASASSPISAPRPGR